MKKFLAICCAVVFFAYSQIAWAGTAIGPWVGNQTAIESMVYYGGTSYSKAQKSMGAGARWNPDLLESSGLGVRVTQNVALPVGAGAANTALSGYISPAGVLGVMGTVLGGPWGAAATVAAIALPPVLDWLALADVRPNAANTGMETRNTTVCSVAPCYGYTNNYSTSVFSSPSAAGADAASRVGIGQGATVISVSDPSLSSGSCLLWSPSYGYYSYPPCWDRVSVAPSPASWSPVAYPDYAQRLSGIPVSTALINSLLDAGYTFPLDGLTVTGTATVSAPPVVVSTPVPKPAGGNGSSTLGGNPYNLPSNTATVTSTVNGSRDVVIDGKTYSIPTKRIVTSTYDPAVGATTSILSDASDPHTVSNTTNTTSSQTYGPKVDPSTGQTVPSVTSNTSTSTVTTITNNTTNNVVSNTTSTTNANPDKPVDPCDANPDRIGCLKIDTPDGEIPKSSKTITYSSENIFGSGSCPANLTANIGTLGKTVTVWDWQKTCEYSLPLRALIMALAGFAAFLIVMPVKVDV